MTSSLYGHLKGRRVVTTHKIHGNRLAKDFPGWGTTNYDDFLVPMQGGLHGTVINVESHGSNPWTRFGIEFDDGSHAYGVHPDEVWFS
jgi:hypothetical protein